MSKEDYEIFNQIRRDRQERRNKRLAEADDRGWKKHSDTHWYRYIGGKKLHYWPSTKKWLYNGVYYRGSLPKGLWRAIDAQNDKAQDND